MAATAVARPGCVYLLVERDTFGIRYVGKTQNRLGPAERLRQHLWVAQHEVPRTYLYKWLRSLTEDPLLQVAGWFPADALDDAERAWVAYGREHGWHLVNGTEGGTGGPTRTGMRNTALHKERAGAANRGKERPAALRDQIRRTKLANPQELERIAALAHVGGRAAAAVCSIPRCCMLCRQVVPGVVAWRSHMPRAHPDIVRERRVATSTAAANARWARR